MKYAKKGVLASSAASMNLSASAVIHSRLWEYVAMHVLPQPFKFEMYTPCAHSQRHGWPCPAVQTSGYEA